MPNAINRPRLRFPKFEGEWKAVSLAHLCEVITKGTTPKTFEYGPVKFIKIESLDDRTIQLEKCSEIDIKTHESELKRSMLKEDDILFAIAGATIGKVGIVERHVLPANTNQALAIIRLSDKSLKEFILYTLSSVVMKKYIYQNISVGAQPNISLGQMGDFKFSLPTEKERRKIADFLSSVDKKISLLKEKHALLTQYKKGVMQKLFKQEIRFKDDNGNDFPNWQEFSLSEVATPIKRKATEAVENVMTISAGKGFLSQEERFSQVIAGTSLDKYTHLKQGEFSYNRGNSKSYTYGCIYKLDKEQALVPYVYRSFSLDKGDADFFSHLFQFKYLDRQLRRLISSSARMDGLLNIGEKDFYQVRVPFPCEDEQKKIAEFLDALDTKLDAVNQQIELTQTFKKGLLQQMFV